MCDHYDYYFSEEIEARRKAAQEYNDRRKNKMKEKNAGELKNECENDILKLLNELRDKTGLMTNELYALVEEYPSGKKELKGVRIILE